MIAVASKTCTKCREEKLVSEFAANMRNRSGLQSHCRVCQRSYNTPAVKAAARRRKGLTSAVYVTRAETLRLAAEKRAAKQEKSGRYKVWLASVVEARNVKARLSQPTQADDDEDQMASRRKLYAERDGKCRLIRLSGRYAVGAFAFALVDADAYSDLECWAWKAKPNGSGSGIYAVRNIVVGSRWAMVRMHRQVLGLADDDDRDVDHVNHDPLDNRRENLRACDRSTNIKNARLVQVSKACQHCSAMVRRITPATRRAQPFSCDDCRLASKRFCKARSRSRRKEALNAKRTMLQTHGLPLGSLSSA